MENSYSIQGYTIEGLSRLNNTRHEIHVETKQKRAKRKPAKTGLDNKHTKLTAEQIEWLKANFATTRREDLAKALNVSSRTVGNYARRYNLVKDAECVRKWVLEGQKKSRTEESLAKLRATKRAIIEEEKRRILYGLEQKTKYKIGSNPRRKSLRRDMKRRHGYVILERDSDIIYYTDETRRSAVQEQHAVALGFEIRKK